MGVRYVLGPGRPQGELLELVLLLLLLLKTFAVLNTVVVADMAPVDVEH